MAWLVNGEPQGRLDPVFNFIFTRLLTFIKKYLANVNLYRIASFTIDVVFLNFKRYQAYKVNNCLDDWGNLTNLFSIRQIRNKYKIILVSFDTVLLMKTGQFLVSKQIISSFAYKNAYLYNFSSFLLCTNISFFAFFVFTRSLLLDKLFIVKKFEEMLMKWRISGLQGELLKYSRKVDSKPNLRTTLVISYLYASLNSNFIYDRRVEIFYECYKRDYLWHQCILSYDEREVDMDYETDQNFFLVLSFGFFCSMLFFWWLLCWPPL